MRISDIVTILDAEVLAGSKFLDREIPCAFSCDLISDILKCTAEQTMLLTGLTNPQIIRTAEMIDLLGIVIVRGNFVAQEVIDEADEAGVPLLRTKLTMYESSGRLFAAGLRSCKMKI
ncbi:MAG: transcriptional regulator [Candidatus Coatesbacteria bacterium]|nr:transcriptional regulator [Candidatus Coatesbacteria bacterium]